MYKIIVIGGGPAGMAAAVSAYRHMDMMGLADELELVLLEKNEKLGKKLFITGKGRCNVTNASDMKTVMENVVTNPRFLYAAFNRFSNTDLMEIIEEAGCPLKIERGQRVFPVSDHSSDIIRAWEKLLKQCRVKVMLKAEVKELILEEGKVTGVRLRGGKELRGSCVILATGGVSYPSTGSTGDGYRFAAATGHSLTERRPALVPLEIQEGACRQMMGLSLKNINASVYNGAKELYTEFGEMLFTHFGVSGPVILSASSVIAGCYGINKEKPELLLKLDLKPALSAEKLDERILRDFEKNINRQLKNSLGELLPSGIIEEVIRQSGIPGEKKVNEITRKERGALVKALKELTFHVRGTRGFNEAIITQGGVSVKDVDPKTMASKKAAGLFFAGEVLDVDAFTGGYNLQIAWSTGWAAGIGAAEAALEG